MSEPRRRRNDYDPEASLIKRLEKSRMADLIARIVVTLIVGGGAGFAITEKKQIDTTNAVTDVSNMKREYDLFVKDYGEFRERNRERNRDRDEQMSKLRDRILILETQLDELRRRRAAQ